MDTWATGGHKYWCAATEAEAEAEAACVCVPGLCVGRRCDSACVRCPDDALFCGCCCRRGMEGFLRDNGCYPEGHPKATAPVMGAM